MMKAEQLGFDLRAMIEPQKHADFMALATEALSEIKIFNAHLANILAKTPAERVRPEGGHGSFPRFRHQ